MPNYETSITPVSLTLTAGGATQNVNVNAGTGANRDLEVWIAWRNLGGDITGVTYNGVAMTSLGSIITQGTVCAHGFGLAGPASGTNVLAITHTSAGNADAVVGAWVANAVNQTTPRTNYNTAQGSGGTPNIVSSVTITSETGSLVNTFHISRNTVATLSVTPTGWTERQDSDPGLNGLSMAYGDALGVASVVCQGTWNNGAITVDWIAVGASIQAAPIPLVAMPCIPTIGAKRA